MAQWVKLQFPMPVPHTEVPVQALAVLLWIQLLNDVPRKVAGGGSST